MTSESSRDYSRTEYVFGKDALQRMQQATFLVLGCSGCGAEVAKNIFLTGCSVALYDPTVVTSLDFTSNPFLTLYSVGQRKDVIVYKAMVELNPQKSVSYIELTDIRQLLQYDAVVFTEFVSKFSIYEISDFCHDHSIPFVLAQALGLAGRLFCDFGDKFTVTDRDGELVSDITISSVMVDFLNAEPLVSIELSELASYEDGALISLSDIKLQVRKGEVVDYELSKNLSDCINNSYYRIKMLDPRSFQLQLNETSNQARQLRLLNEQKYQIDYLRGGYSLLIKEPAELSFERYSSAVKNPLFCDELIDFVKVDYRTFLHKLFMLVDAYKPLPSTPYDVYQTNGFLAHLSADFQANYELMRLGRIFAGANMAQLSPVASIIGGWGAQEALKSVSGKFTPVRQFYYYDCFELIKAMPADAVLCNNRYDGQIAAFGRAQQNVIQNKSLFLVGAGALGCELIKIFALSGACTADNTVLSVTDLDQIENSNLSRQFLFREADSGYMKAHVVARRAQAMNGALNVCPMTSRVGVSTPLEPSFWRKHDIVCNALDNVETRRFVDQKCVEFCKPLLESGTLGSKANAQVIVPRLTQIYSAMQEPASAQAPSCTIHNFPSTMVHCIVYVMSEFAGIFDKAATDLKLLFDCKSDSDLRKFCQQIEAEKSSMKQRVIQLCSFCQFPLQNAQQAALFALALFRKYFIDTPRTLLAQFPADARNNDGTPFWAAEKRPPRPLQFNLEDEFHLCFAVSGTILLGKIFGVEIHKKEADAAVRAVLKQLHNDVNEVQIFKSEELVKQFESTFESAEVSYTRKTTVYDFMSSRLVHKPQNQPVPVQFDKDDATGCQVDFVSAFANLRAYNYEIPNVGTAEIRRISGNIIPAMITTTAAICGHVGVEFYKLCFGFDRIEDFKQIFMNFALPMLQFSENEPCTKYPVGNRTLTVWDQLQMQGDITIQDLLDYVKSTLGIALDSVMIGSRALYMSFENKVDKRPMKIRQLIRNGNKPGHFIDPDGDLLLDVLPEDDTIDLPSLKLLR